MKFDPIDIRIVNKLTDDARIPFSQLAKSLKVSNTLIHQRIKKLRDHKVIEKATFPLDPISIGYETSAYTQIMLTNAKHHKKIEAELFKIPEIVECVNIAGRYALIVKIFAKNNRHLRDLIYEKIQPLEGVEGTNTIFSFETAFRRSVPLEIDYQ